MTDRELDAAIAEKVMGWEVTRVPYMQDSYKRRLSGGYETGYVPSFSTDRNAAALVLKRIGELKLQRQFNLELARQIWPPDRSADTFHGADEFAFEKQCATPRQLMEAALAAVTVTT